MAKPTKKAAAATATPQTPSQVKQSIIALKAEQKTLESINSAKFKTSGTYPGLDYKGTLKNEKDNNVIHKLLATLKLHIDSYNAVGDQLVAAGVYASGSYSTLSYDDDNAQDIVDDCMLQLSKNRHQDRYNQLQKLIDKGEKYLSETDLIQDWMAEVDSAGVTLPAQIGTGNK